MIGLGPAATKAWIPSPVDCQGIPVIFSDTFHFCLVSFWGGLLGVDWDVLWYPRVLYTAFIVFICLSVCCSDWLIFFSLSSRSVISSALSSLLFIAFISAFVLASEFSHFNPLYSFWFLSTVICISTGWLSSFSIFFFFAVLGFHSRLRAFSRSSSWGLFPSCSLGFLPRWLLLWCPGWAALRRVESSWARDWTCAPCTDRWILYHWTTSGDLQFLVTSLLNLGSGRLEDVCFIVCSFKGILLIF